MEKATLGGGCFWCIEAIFQHLSGVSEVISGYSGGHTENPSYEQVCSGKTGHAEVVQITFDPEVIAFREILDVFFRVHDPTQKDRQGNDVGPQYRSVIFYHDEEQRKTAEKFIEDLTAQKQFDKPVVTEIAPYENFYPAENYHQDYYLSNPSKPYCAVIIEPKLDKFKSLFTDRLKSDI